MPDKKNAVALVSGGLDSAVALALAIRDGYQVHALSFNYGQRHSIELEAAKQVANSLGAARHFVCDINLRMIGGSALTSDIAVPKGRTPKEMLSRVPITYVPARNTIFLSYALAWCEVIPAADVFIGVNAIDYSGYPDCRPEYLQAFQHLANLATKSGVEGKGGISIHAPLIHMTKADIIRTGYEAGVDFSLTRSCYDPSPEGMACGACDSCILRRQGFKKAGIPDPTRYTAKKR
jgi:7-cyano-7-deazaguanine synthase